MQAVKAGTFGDPFTVYSVGVCCSCDKGRRRAEDSGDESGRGRRPIYNDKQWLLMEKSVHDAGERERFLAWMERTDFHAVKMEMSEWNPDREF